MKVVLSQHSLDFLSNQGTRIQEIKMTRFFLFVGIESTQNDIPLTLKVVVIEKGRGLGGWLLFEDGFGPWRSMSVCFFNFVVVFSSTNFHFRSVKTS